MLVDTFQNRLKDVMYRRQIKQNDLVSLTGINKSIISKYVNGLSKPKNDNLLLLAKALNTNEAWLLRLSSKRLTLQKIKKAICLSPSKLQTYSNH